jgi:hypothetical protein
VTGPASHRLLPTSWTSRACLGELDALARDARPRPRARIHQRTTAFPASFCLLLKANAGHHQMPLRARAYDRSTSSFKGHSSPPRPGHFRDGTIPNRMHDLRRTTSADVHGSIPHVRSTACTRRYTASTKRLPQNNTVTEPIREHDKLEDMPSMARITTARQRHQSNYHTSKYWNKADQEGPLLLLVHTTLEAHSHHTD